MLQARQAAQIVPPNLDITTVQLAAGKKFHIIGLRSKIKAPSSGKIRKKSSKLKAAKRFDKRNLYTIDIADVAEVRKGYSTDHIHEQCDQIGWFIGLWVLFEAFGNN